MWRVINSFHYSRANGPFYTSLGFRAKGPTHTSLGRSPMYQTGKKLRAEGPTYKCNKLTTQDTRYSSLYLAIVILSARLLAPVEVRPLH